MPTRILQVKGKKKRAAHSRRLRPDLPPSDWPGLPSVPHPVDRSAREGPTLTSRHLLGRPKRGIGEAGG